MNIVNPLYLISLIYSLIFIFRPILILYFDAETLDFENIDFNDWIYVLVLVFISLIGIISASVLSRFGIRKNQNNISRALNKSPSWPINRLFVYLYYILTFLSVFSLILYGSALTNTLDRVESPSSYQFFFFFIIIFKLQQVITIYIFSIYLNKKPSASLVLKLLFYMSPAIALFTSGRAAFFFMLISYGIVYIIKNRIKTKTKLLGIVLLVTIFFSYTASTLGAIRIIITEKNYEYTDIISAVTQGFSGSRLIQTLTAASWDYSVFDSLVRVVNSSESFMLGYTNISYLLAYIPRVIWPGKPYDQGFGLGMTSEFYGEIFTTTGSTFAGTIIGEGYWNFWVFGVYVYSFIFGYFIFHLYYKAIFLRTDYSIALYAIAAPLMFSMIRGGTDFIVQFFLMTIIPFWFLLLLFKHRKR